MPTSSVRIEYPGAVYHVTKRSNYQSDVFATASARAAFLRALDQACERAGWLGHAWYLMSNHYHLALRTPRPNLVAGMQWFQSTFATRFNRFHKERGHVFQGRYKIPDVIAQSFIWGETATPRNYISPHYAAKK